MFHFVVLPRAELLGKPSASSSLVHLEYVGRKMIFVFVFGLFF